MPTFSKKMYFILFYGLSLHFSTTRNKMNEMSSHTAQNPNQGRKGS
jgi:hypothetical protein